MNSIQSRASGAEDAMPVARDARMPVAGAEPAGGARDTGRLEAFSDGVIAIAITLLVLEIRVPHLADFPTGTTLAGVLWALWPSYVGYVTSFVVIGIMWANHHRLFRYIARVDHVLILLNTLLLLCIAFIPFPTALLAEYLEDAHEGRTAALVYSGTLVATGLVYNLLWRYASTGHRLLREDADPRVVRRIRRWFAVGPLLYGLSFAAAFLSVKASLVVYLVIALLYVLPIDPDR